MIRSSICTCCGSREGTTFAPVMWKSLGDEWGLSEDEYRYVDHQQGETCVQCGSNLRSQALALAVLRAFGHRGYFQAFARSIRGRLLHTLEINQAGQLTQFFPRLSRHELRSYPDIDMMHMANIRSSSYDLVIHSDTLEHIPDPIRGLAECCRVLRPGGACCFTVPIIVGRLGRTRQGLPPSYHGSPSNSENDLLVWTEYGADAWRQVLQAGFVECRMVAVHPPTAHALVGIKGDGTV
jgi:SAM-dependent methyltransferase